MQEHQRKQAHTRLRVQGREGCRRGCWGRGASGPLNKIHTRPHLRGYNGGLPGRCVCRVAPLVLGEALGGLHTHAGRALRLVCGTGVVHLGAEMCVVMGDRQLMGGWWGIAHPWQGQVGLAALEHHQQRTQRRVREVRPGGAHCSLRTQSPTCSKYSEVSMRSGPGRSSDRRVTRMRTVRPLRARGSGK